MISVYICAAIASYISAFVGLTTSEWKVPAKAESIIEVQGILHHLSRYYQLHPQQQYIQKGQCKQ
jgi:hypothetical protein